MNERIEELAIQAGGVWSGGYVEQSNGNSVWTDKKFVEDVDPEKFAELIMRECAEAAARAVKSDTDKIYYFESVMKSHFGVEE